MRISVVYSRWGADGFDEPLHGGEHDLEGVTAEQARSIAGAHAAGAVEVLDASPEEEKLLDGHVQTQADGEAALEAAMGDWVDDVYEEHLDTAGNVVYRTLSEPGHWSGPWRRGNLLHFVHAKKERLALDAWAKDVGQEKVDEMAGRAAARGEALIFPGPLTDEEVSELERQIARAEADLAKTEEDEQ